MAEISDSWKRISKLAPDHAFLQWLKPYGEDLWLHLERVPQLDPLQAQAVLRGFLSQACQAQNVLNIEIGRYALLKLPREWVLSHIDASIATLNLDDDWEYRRLLEVFDLLEPQCLPALIERGRTHSSSDIRETAQDWLEKGSGS